MTRQITKLLDDNEIKLAVPIQFRTKSWDSIRNKCEQGRFYRKENSIGVARFDRYSVDTSI